MLELAKAFDSAYTVEVNVFGFLPPPNDFGAGGDTKYDIYIMNLGGGIYGRTKTEESISISKSSINLSQE